MCAPAQLAAEIVDLDHTHELAVLLAEERHRPQIAGVLEAGRERAHGMVLDDAPVDQFLDLGESLRPERLVVGEIEAELVGPHGRSRPG